MELVETYFFGIVFAINTILFLQISSVLFSIKRKKQMKVFCFHPLLT